MRLWQPPRETIEAIAAVLSSHWLAAKAHPERLFWPGTASWLHNQALRLADGNVLFGARYLASLSKNSAR
jgi:hypothetical protein